jgi:iron complex transport system substrate-binding protein
VLPRRSVLLLLVFLLAACSGPGGPGGLPADIPLEPQPDPEYPVMISGVALESRPARVLSLAPAITEKLCDLNYQDRIIGISDFCDYPVALSGTTRFGTAQAPYIHDILYASPHVVLSAAQLPVDAAKALGDAGIPVIIFSHSFSVIELEEVYTTIAVMMDGRTSGRMIGERFVENLNARIDEIAAAPMSGTAPKKALYLSMLDFHVATGNTLEGELLQRIGFENIAEGQRNRWLFDPQEANSDEGRALFESIEMLFIDENAAPISMLENSEFYKDLPCVVDDLYIYINKTAFERQSLRMLEQLEIMAAGK